ncbi:hypothetical protein KSZ_33720 [Dictyobacter formicarum]|uniref:Uncharacterized protein n=1 Tax=Dictyobacter formicarum TaxID=2778368 RepID=A0ABQ3VJS1_9CHLR|nr:hypothetical protein KSZ_33720 [Dictyobacter formicarum]
MPIRRIHAPDMVIRATSKWRQRAGALNRPGRTYSRDIHAEQLQFRYFLTITYSYRYDIPKAAEEKPC